jgi:3-isopropylmalate/(R)-2-methylmalate dehydratase small subunit
MDRITRITSRTIAMPQTDIDTDQIMPARFLTTTNKEGLGDAAFADWRYDKSGAPVPDFPLNAPDAKERQVLVAGNNFGCGSSREHAPWGLVDFGFRAVISTRIADIFRNNALKNGLVPVIVPADVHAELLANPGTEVTVDVEARTLTLPDGHTVEFPLDGFSRHCLLEGIDQLGFLLSQAEAIAVFEQNRPWQP